MAHVLIVGKAFSGIKEYLVSRGHEFTILQDKGATKFPDKKYRNRVVVDVFDERELLNAVDEIHAAKQVDATFVTYEAYVVTNALIAKHLGLPGIGIASAKACTDKEYMRDLFAKAPVKISPDFRVVNSKEDLTQFATTHDFPLILKPANLSKSLLVTKSDNLDELLDNYQKALDLIDTTYRKYAPGREAKLLIEEYLDGHIHSVDVFNDADGVPHVLENVVDYQTGYDIGYADNFHYSRLLPSALSESEIQEIRNTAEIGCRALGMKSTPAHVEIIYTKDGPRIVEIGARNGGYRERMHWLANGIDITANALALALDQPLRIAPVKHDSVGVFELFPKNPGIFTGLDNEPSLKNLRSFEYLSVKAKKGDFVGKAGDGYKMCAVVILANPNHKEFESDANFLSSSVSVTTI